MDDDLAPEEGAPGEGQLEARNPEDGLPPAANHEARDPRFARQVIQVDIRDGHGRINLDLEAPNGFSADHLWH